MGKVRFTSLIFLFFLLSMGFSIASVSNVPGQIIIKVHKGSDTEIKWKSGYTENALEDLGIYGIPSSVYPFIRTELQKALDHWKSGRYYRNSYDIFDNIKRIYVIKFSDSINIESLIAKIKSYPDVEYSEPMPVREIVAITNDPLVDDQYYLENIQASEAWESINTNDTLLIGIVDTGVDYLHEDLAANIYINPGESGRDNQGNDKRTNRIDDDNNGFTDDWHGWDFVSGTSQTGSDNNPMPGHWHGTHVAGIAAAVTNNFKGIAGTAKNVKILPVKIGKDDPEVTTVQNSYEGILYAATLGAKVINCSWGSTSRSESELEVLQAAAGMGSVVVAAAGNDDLDVAFFPAAHQLVLSVASVNYKDEKASYSNYNRTVDVSAPGSTILSTMPDNNYDRQNGTSMASPVAAGVAAMVMLKFPDYDPLQVIEHIKATTDNIDTLNPEYNKLIGKGRVNAFKAVTTTDAISVILNSYTVRDENNDSIFDPGERITIDASFLNVLSPAGDITIVVQVADTNYDFSLSTTNYALGTMQTKEDKPLPGSLTLIVPENIAMDYTAHVEFLIYSGNDLLNTESIQLTFKPSYRTMNANNIAVTFNSRGNIGFNDYSENMQGQGFKYKEGPNLLFEGALMIATAADRMSDVARSIQQQEQNEGFWSDSIFVVKNPGDSAAQEGFASFFDDKGEFEAGVDVRQHVYQFNEPGRQDFIITVYDIINKSGTDFNSLYCGLFFDWDIGPSGGSNQADYDSDGRFGFVSNVRQQDLPEVAVLLLSPYPNNYYALDNNGGNMSPNIYDGFSREEKWQTMTSSLSRTKSGVTDVSTVTSAGPISVKDMDTVRVAFALIASDGFAGLRTAADQARKAAKELNLPVFTSTLNRNNISIVYPNPSNGEKKITIMLTMVKNSNISLDVFDLTGNRVAGILENKYYETGTVTLEFDPSGLSQGSYYLRLKSEGGDVESFPFVYAR